jgi:5'-nucleotidase
MKNVVIPDQDKLDKIKAAITAGGADKLHILADFERTMTKCFVKGERIPSLISVLRDGNYLTKDYAAKAQALFDKYHPIEIDPKLSKKEKSKAMEEWWRTHYKLLIKTGLKKNDLKAILSSDKIQFRDGALEFLDFTHQKNIPVVIISGAGVGKESISMLLEKVGRLYDNIHIVSNRFIWDKNGRAIGVREPIIHVFNKDEMAIQKFPFYSQIKDRKNVILLGDTLEDLDMIHGFDYENLLSIGFLNEEVKESLPFYKKVYDVVITNDGDMNFVNELVHECIKGHQASDDIKQK